MNQMLWYPAPGDQVCGCDLGHYEVLRVSAGKIVCLTLEGAPVEVSFPSYDCVRPIRADGSCHDTSRWTRAGH